MILRDDYIKYIRDEVTSKVPNYKYYTGIVRDFIMTGEHPLPFKRKQERTDMNNLIHIKLTPNLYTQAISSLWLVTGDPVFFAGTEAKYDLNHPPDILKHLFTNEQTEPTDDRYISAFVVMINIINFKKERKLPLIFTKEKYVNECCYMTVDNILLEDLIKYHNITYKIAYGYMWKTTRDHSIRRISIHDCVKYPDLMIKLGDQYTKKVDVDKSDSFVEEYKYYICDSFVEEGDDKHITFILNKLTDDEYVNCLFDLQVLNMARHILNKYIYLAEDTRVNLYFDDNGDLYLSKKQFNKYRKKFEKLYRIDLMNNVC